MVRLRVDRNKACSKCGAVKALTEFGPDKRKLDGTKAACRACCRATQNRYRAENTEHVRTIEKRAMASFAQRKPERLRAINLKYARANAARMNEYSRQYRRLNPDKKRAETQRYRARKALAPGSHTASDIRNQLAAQNHKCWWCSKTVPGNGYHVDHLVPLHRQGSNGPENIVIACPACNLGKNARMPWDFNGRLL